MLSDVSETKYSEIPSDRNSPQELGFRTFHGTDCGCSSCGRNSTHFHCRICGYGTSQTANVVAHRRICISTSDLQQKEYSRLTPTTESTLMQLEALSSTQSYPYYSPVGPGVSLPSSTAASPATTNSTVMTTQQSAIFNFVIPSQNSQYSSLYGTQTVFPNPNLFSPSSFNSYGQLDPPWLPQPRLIPPGVHSSSPSSDLLGSGRNHYDKLESSSSPSCYGRIGSIETTAIGMCSPLTAEAYKVVSKEFQSKIDSQNWYCNSSSVMSFNSQASSCKFSDPVPSCSISLLLLEQNDLKSTEECINVDDLCFETAKTELKSDLKENQNYTSCMEMSKKSVDTFKEPAGKKGELNVLNLNRIREDNVDLEPHSEESDIIVEELESDKTHSTTLTSEMKQNLLLRCLVCNKSPPEDDDFVKIGGEIPVTTSTSQVSILTKLSQVIENDYFNKLTDCLICPRCLNLINVVDELENKLQSAKKDLVEIYRSKDSNESSLENLDKENSTESSPQTKLLCEICNKHFSSVSYLEKHKQQHTKVFSYYCEYCGKGFAVLQKLENHLALHSKSSRFQCELCGKRFSQKQNLMDHLKKHKGEFKYQCEICQKGFIRRSVYNTHLQTHNSEPCICHHCGKQFKNLAYLYYHIKICSGDLKYNCNDCDKKFPIKSLLKKHISLKHDSQFKFNCTVCKRGFGKKSEMKSHMRTHSDKKPYKCSKCNNSYKSMSNLNQHAKVHSNNKVLECSVCEKKFTRKDSLKDHMNQHTGDKPYKCTTCWRTFSHRINYNIHMKRHSGTLKQTPCPVCGKLFIKGLKDHLVSHSGQKPHTCEHCSATFTVRSSLNKHIKTRHSL